MPGTRHVCVIFRIDLGELIDGAFLEHADGYTRSLAQLPLETKLDPRRALALERRASRQRGTEDIRKSHLRQKSNVLTTRSQHAIVGQSAKDRLRTGAQGISEFQSRGQIS